MRWLARLLIAASLTGLSWWMIQSAAIVRWLSTPTVSGLPVELLADARRSIAYPLSTDDWLSFPLLPGGGRLRLLTNAQLPRALADPAVSEPEQWSYALRYRVLDLADRVLSSDVLNLRTEISLVELAGAGRLMTIHQAPGDAAIADGRVLYLADPGLEATMLQLRLEPLSAPVIGAVARAYQRQQVPEHQLGYQWQRLSGDVRQQLAEASVHGGELLSGVRPRFDVLNSSTPRRTDRSCPRTAPSVRRYAPARAG